VVDVGEEFNELRGVELRGRMVQMDGVLRNGSPNPVLQEPEKLFIRKYNPLSHDGRHNWLRLVPDKIVSWDFRKIRE
jgi:hypothetical protein